MSIRESENALFAEWAADRPGLVADGVVDEDEFLASEPRLLFVLKEVNDPNGGGWDLREFLRSGARERTWNTVTRWVQGIRQSERDVPWSELERIDNFRRSEALRGIAAMNLKKSPGIHTANASMVAAAAAADRGRLMTQFALYQNEVDFIVCCGVSGLFHEAIRFASAPVWKTTSRGVWFHEFAPRKFVLAATHPETRCSPNLLYYGLVDAVREIRRAT